MDGVRPVLVVIAALAVRPVLASAGAIDPDEAAALLAEAARLSALDGGELWGRELYGPMMFVDPRTREVVTNARGTAGDLVPVPGHENLFAGTLEANVPIGNTEVKWGGVHWSMVMWPVGPPGPGAGALLMHESFHRVQPDLRIPLLSPANSHLDTGDGRAWLRLEWRALAAALAASEHTASDAAIGDALTFRAQRHALFGAEAAEQERQLELNEGLAEYTGLRLGGADDEAVRGMAIANLERYDRAESLVRSFAYASGPAYGLLLDDRLESWRRRMRANADMADLLGRCLRWSVPRDLADRARERGAVYGLAEVQAAEDARELARQDRLDALRAKFVDGPRLILLVTDGFQYSFNPHDMEAVDGTGTYYGTMQATGAWGRLVVTGGVVLVDEGHGRRALVVPAPTEPADGRALHGDGWTLHMAPGATVTDGPRPGDTVVR